MPDVPDPHVVVVSCGRPARVPAMNAQLPPDAHWYVGDELDAENYTAYGASNVVVAGGLVAARNRALDNAFAGRRPCVQLSDDLRQLRLITPDAVRPLTVASAIELLAQAAHQTGAKLAGASPTDNIMFARAAPAVARTGFIVGDLMYVAPCPLRFHPELPLKEDYDYTCQHLAAYGCVARVNAILPSFAHRTNRGGAVAYRTPALEQHAIGRLRARWPDAIRLNPRRANEVLLRWKEPTA